MKAFLPLPASLYARTIRYAQQFCQPKKLINESNHSAKNMSDSLSEVLNEWGVFDKITDGQRLKYGEGLSNSKKTTTSMLSSYNYLIVQDCLANDKIKTLLAKCKSIVTFFKSSTIAYAKLKEAQYSDRPLGLKQECQTRWNSAFVMIQRILRTRDAISKVLLNTSKALLPLSADEVYVLEDLMQILSPFEQATLHTSSSSLLTVSMVIAIVCGLLHNLENLRAKLVTDLGIQACTILIKSTNERLVPYETSLNTEIATLLEPRFKKDCFC